MDAREYLNGKREFCMGKQEEALVIYAFEAGQQYPTEQTARAIWDAAINWEHAVCAPKHYKPAPDFETFYKQLMEKK